MPGGELPRLAEYERPAAAPAASPAVPGELTPSAGFGQFARQLDSAPPKPAPLPQPVGRRIAASLLYVLSASIGMLVALIAVDRVRLIDRMEQGTLSRHTAVVSDRLFDLAITAQLVTTLLAVLTLLLWVAATVGRARARYPRQRLSPAAAVLTWFIPIGQWWMPWNYLRRACACESSQEPRALTAWQVFWLADLAALAVVNGVSRGVKTTDTGVFRTVAICCVLVGVLHAGTAIAGIVAMRQIDTLTSGDA